VVQRDANGGLHVFLNGFWKWNFGCEQGVYGALAFDRLHVAKGLIGDLINALNWVLGNEQEPGSVQSVDGALSSYVRGKHALMDRRFSKCTAYLGASTVYLPRLTGGFYSKKRAEVGFILILVFNVFKVHPRHGTLTFGYP
jgi:hypothetical protein